MKKTTLVIGASTNENRYSYQAVKQLRANDYPVVAYGLRAGEVFGVQIETQWSNWLDIDTITLYVGPNNQSDLFEKIMQIQPQRVIFNPGTENMLLAEKLSNEGIHVIEACTLVLLTTRQYDIA
jgi:uncharacterized protein